MNMPNSTPLRWSIWLFLAILLVSAVFIAFPALDIYASQPFFRGGFWLKDIPALRALRMALIWGMYGFALFVLAVFVLRWLRGQRLRTWGYALAVILTGPLFLVNAVFKTYWGRARPVDISEFGGDRLFSPPWFISDQCDVNCSFTSGEGGAIATTALLIAFLAWPKLGPAGRRRLGLAMGALVLLTAGLRVAMGQHFLSDTLLSVLICALVATLLYPLFFPDRTARYAVSYLPAKASHKGLGYEIELLVPAEGRHCPAVRAFLDGKYYEAFSHRSFRKILRHRPGNAVHAGAFFGDMLHTLSHAADTVFAFEPVLDNYILAKRNIARLGLENVVLQNAGLGAKTGFANLQTHASDGRFRGGGSSIVTRKNLAPEIVEHVPVFALDELPVRGVSLLHLDVEGYEAEVLQGAKQLITTSKPVILLEDNKKNCAELLEGMGYRRVFHYNALHYWALPEDMEFVAGLKPA